LLRKVTSNRNIWITTLEYQGDAVIPIPLPIEPGPKGVKWFVDFCREHPSQARFPDTRHDLEFYKVRVCVPRYPSPGRQVPAEYFDRISLVPESERQGAKGSRRYAKLVTDEYRVEMATEAEGKIKRSHASNLKLTPTAFGSVRQFMETVIYSEKRKEGMGTVFVSQPIEKHLGRTHGSIVREMLKTQLELESTHYIEADGSPSLCEAATKMIRDCDFFYSIWHPYNDVPGQLSPWMPFEFGVARSLGKPYMMVVHDSLFDQVTQFVGTALALPRYVDLIFEEVVNRTMETCESLWLR
jgi:hypothetical protein